MQGDKIYALRSTIKNYGNAGMVLIAVTLVAMLLANSIFSDAYFSWWNMPVSLRIGTFNLFSHNGHTLTLLQFINDALMAIFFFSVGLEIKREVLVGELSTLKQALLPVIAACGGILVPVLLFRLFAAGDGDILRGSAIPMATDIAFSLGVLMLLGKRVPLSLKIFLATLAVADDIGGILVIALFYSGAIDFSLLLYAGALLLILFLAGRKGIHSSLFYAILGIAIWFLFLNSGIHPTIAGVLIAFTVPAHPKLNTRRYIERIRNNISLFPLAKVEESLLVLSKEQIDLLKSVESASNKVISPLQRMEDALRPVVNYIVIPLFAFANAGVSLSGMDISGLFQGVSLPVFSGLVLGKFIGIFSFSFLAIRFGLGTMPAGSNWKMMAGIALLGGIGFTVSMFIASLSFASLENGAVLLQQAKMGILLGSLVAGILGFTVLNVVLPKQNKNKN